MIKSKLTRSVVVLAFFYLSLGMLWFGLQSYTRVYTMIERLPPPAREAVGELPEKKSLTVFDQGPLQGKLIKAWTVPVTMWWSVTLVAGIGLAMLVYIWVERWSGRHAKAHLVANGLLWLKKKRPGFRKLTPTLGFMPKPVALSRTKSQVRIRGVEMNKAQLALWDAIFDTLSFDPDAFAGDGHGVGLFQHTINVCEKMLELDGVTPQMMLVAAAHDIGKLTHVRTKKEDGTKYFVRGHAQASAMLLATMPEFLGLPEIEAAEIRMAIKYEHSRWDLPFVPGTNPARIKELIEALRRVDGTVTAEEKRALVAASIPEDTRPTYAFEQFTKLLPTLPIRTHENSGSNVAFKRRHRLFILESGLRQFLESQMSPDMYAALNMEHRVPGQVHPFVRDLMVGFDNEGWLLKKTTVELRNGAKEEIDVAPENAIWDIQSGTKDFYGVIVVDVPPHYLTRITHENTKFNIKITGLHRPRNEPYPLELPVTAVTNEQKKNFFLEEEKKPPKGKGAQGTAKVEKGLTVTTVPVVESGAGTDPGNPNSPSGSKPAPKAASKKVGISRKSVDTAELVSLQATLFPKEASNKTDESKKQAAQAKPTKINAPKGLKGVSVATLPGGGVKPPATDVANKSETQ